jgi:hypothetical protein
MRRVAHQSGDALIAASLSGAFSKPVLSIGRQDGFVVSAKPVCDECNGHKAVIRAPHETFG